MTIGTIFEGSHVPLRKWLRACQLVELGHVNATQLHECMQITYRAALWMTRAISEVLGSEPAAPTDDIVRRALEVWV